MTENKYVYWFPDTRTERELSAHKLSWKLKEVSEEEIDWEEGLRNNARFESFNKERGERYMMVLRQGGKLPAIVLRLDPSRKVKKYVPFGGNHRGWAGREVGALSFLAYVFSTDDELIIQNLPKRLNVIEGDSLSVSERQAAALQLVVKYGWTVEKAAALYQVAQGALHRQIHESRARSRLDKRGVLVPDSVPSTTLQYLDSLENDRVLARAFEHAVESDLNGEEVQVLIKKIKEESTEGDCLNRIEEEVKQYRVAPQMDQENGHVPEKPSKTQEAIQFRSKLNGLILFLKKHGSLRKMGITRKSDRAWYLEKRNEIILLLEEI